MTDEYLKGILEKATDYHDQKIMQQDDASSSKGLSKSNCKHFPDSDDHCFICEEEERKAQLRAMRRKQLKIVVWYEHPPIPDRKFDYIAMYEHDDGDSGRWGNGSTPFMAIKDLIDNINPTEEWEKVNGK